MSGVDEMKVFEYKRGDNFKVKVVVKNSEVFIFKDLAVPTGTSEDVIAAFIELAENAVIGSLIKEGVS